MGNKLKNSIRVSELAKKLCLIWKGVDVEISHIEPFSDINAAALCFSKTTINTGVPNAAAVIAPPDTDAGLGAVIEASNPRLAFARALNILNIVPGFVAESNPPRFGEGVVVSPTAVIGNGVSIGSRTVIGHHVVINDGVHIGEDCLIKSNTVIGEPGFGFERDETGLPVRIIHLGSVIIGDRVELGSLNTVCRATLGNTVIEDDVKTDDHVHIAHNCRIRRGTLITACAELSGGVVVGEYSWIGPNSSVLQKINIGDNSFIGIASNVTKNVLSGTAVAGNPARSLIKKN